MIRIVPFSRSPYLILSGYTADSRWLRGHSSLRHLLGHKKDTAEQAVSERGNRHTLLHGGEIAATSQLGSNSGCYLNSWAAKRDDDRLALARSSATA